MAIVLSSFAPDPEPFAYTGLPDVYIPSTAIAKGEVRYKIADGEVLQPGAGDQQAIDIDCELPGDYGYVLIDLALSLNNIVVGGDVDWDNDLLCWMQDDQGANTARTFEYAINLHSDGQSRSATNRPWKMYRPCNKPTMVVTGRPLLSIQSTNQTVNDVDYQLNLYARFIQFTVEQQHHAGVNTPLPIR